MSKVAIYRSSAGSGKTHALSQTYMALALRYPPDYFKHLLAVTFTNKATAEMKHRVIQYLYVLARGEKPTWASELANTLEISEQELQARSEQVLAAMLHQYGQMQLVTIDSFFQRILRSFAREIGLSGEFVLELNTEAVLERVVEQLIVSFEKDEKLKNTLLNFMWARMDNQKDWNVRRELMNFTRELFREDFFAVHDKILSAEKLTHLMNQWLATLTQAWQQIQTIAREALEAIHQHGYSSADFSRGAAYKAIAALANSKRPWEVELTDGQLNLSNGISKWLTKEKEKVSTLRQLTESVLMPRWEQLVVLYTEQLPLANSYYLVDKNYYACLLTKDIQQHWTTYKKEENIFLLAEASFLLRGIIQEEDTPFIYEKSGSFFYHFLLDEFQDTSGMQWQNFFPLIKNSLDAGHESLIVGDVKQSIYRWRGGNLKLLHEKVVQDIGEKFSTVKNLQDNYRSAKNIVQFNNDFFEHLLQLPELTTLQPLYADVAQNAKRTRDGYVEIQRWQAPKSVDEAYETSKQWLKTKIIELFKMGVRQEDIALLVRKREEAADLYTFLLDLPPDASGRAVQLITQESLSLETSCVVQFVVATLYALHHPAQSLYQAERLFFLAKIRGEKIEHTLFETIAQPDTIYQEHAARWHQLSLYERCEDILRAYQLAHSDPIFVHVFLEAMLQFAQKNQTKDFLDWWEEKGKRTELPASEAQQGIRIMTIHKAKGLQFPYVFVPFAFWRMQPSDRLLWVEAAGGYVPIPYQKKMIDSIWRDAAQEEAALHYADQINMLYVAFTRAEEALFIGVANLSNSIGGIIEQTLQRVNPDLASDSAWTAGSLQVVARKDETPSLTFPLLASPGFWMDKTVIKTTLSKEKKFSFYRIKNVLAKIKTLNTWDETVRNAVEQEDIVAEEETQLSEIKKQITSSESMMKWFSSDNKIRTHVTLLGDEEATIDRVITKANHTEWLVFGEDTKEEMEKNVATKIHTRLQKTKQSTTGYLCLLPSCRVINL